MACQAAGSAWYRALPRWMYPISQPEYSYTGSPLVVEASTARKLHSCSEAMPRWWDSSWAMVEGIRQAGASTLMLDSPVKAK